jgi:DNA-binding winged helix-turn-helix (wHTH) protein
VDVFVRKLRQKLEKASPDWRYIHTHFGIGYRFAAEPAVGEGEAEEPATAPVAEPKRSGKQNAPELPQRNAGDQSEFDGTEQEYELAAGAS